MTVSRLFLSFSLIFCYDFKVVSTESDARLDYKFSSCPTHTELKVLQLFHHLQRDINFLLLSGVILIKKAGDGSKKIKGCWDSIHVVEVQEKTSGRSAHYKLTSTAMLWLQTNKPGSGTMNLGGSLTRQVSISFGIQELLYCTSWK